MVQAHARQIQGYVRFPVVRLAGERLDQVCHRAQNEKLGYQGQG